MPGLFSNISGSCVIGVYVFLKGNIDKDSNQKRRKFDENTNEKSNYN